MSWRRPFEALTPQETLGIDRDLGYAFAKAYLAAGSQTTVVGSLGGDQVYVSLRFEIAK